MSIGPNLKAAGRRSLLLLGVAVVLCCQDIATSIDGATPPPTTTPVFPPSAVFPSNPIAHSTDEQVTVYLPALPPSLVMDVFEIVNGGHKHITTAYGTGSLLPITLNRRPGSSTRVVFRIVNQQGRATELSSPLVVPAGQATSSARTSALHSQETPMMTSAFNRQDTDRANAASPTGSAPTGGGDAGVQCAGLPGKCTVFVPLIVTASLLVLFVSVLLTVLTVRCHRSKAGSPPAVTQQPQGLDHLYKNADACDAEPQVPNCEEMIYNCQDFEMREAAIITQPSFHSPNGLDLQAGLQCNSSTDNWRSPKPSRSRRISILNCNVRTPEPAIFTTAPSPTIEGCEGLSQPVLSTDPDSYPALAIAETSFSNVQSANSANETSTHQQLTPGMCDNTDCDQPTHNTMPSVSSTSAGGLVRNDSRLPVYQSITPTKPKDYQIPDTEQSTDGSAAEVIRLPDKHTYQDVSPNREPLKSYERLSSRHSLKPSNVERRQAGHAGMVALSPGQSPARVPVDITYEVMEKDPGSAAPEVTSVPNKETYQDVSPNREPPKSYEHLSSRHSQKPSNVETRQAIDSTYEVMESPGSAAPEVMSFPDKDTYQDVTPSRELPKSDEQLSSIPPYTETIECRNETGWACWHGYPESRTISSQGSCWEHLRSYGKSFTARH